MAHDKQYKDNIDNKVVRVDRYDYPKDGELYWDKHDHSIKLSDGSVSEKALIIKGNN